MTAIVFLSPFHPFVKKMCSNSLNIRIQTLQLHSPLSVKPLFLRLVPPILIALYCCNTWIRILVELWNWGCWWDYLRHKIHGSNIRKETQLLKVCHIASPVFNTLLHTQIIFLAFVSFR